MRQEPNVTHYFQHPIIFDDLPQTQIISPSTTTVDFWYSQDTSGKLYNQYFIYNDTFLYEKPFFPEIKDLTGIELKVATINYPPYTYYEFVVSCDTCISKGDDFEVILIYDTGT